jgi:hypothetical protein
MGPSPLFALRAVPSLPVRQAAGGFMILVVLFAWFLLTSGATPEARIISPSVFPSPGEVLRVNVDGSGAEAVALSVQIAHGVQAAANLGPDAPVFVAGADLRSAAAVADRLAEQGMTRVWLVTP